MRYEVIRNGKRISSITATAFEIDTMSFGEYRIIASDADGMESFSSEPLLICPAAQKQILEIENFAGRSNLGYSNYSGAGFVEISASMNREISIPLVADSEGRYIIDIRYSNGTGPWNTDNNCAIRSIYLNDVYQGVLVLPQRGTDEWSDWGYSNAIPLDLHKGQNQVRIVFEEWNINMDGEINDAMLDHIRILKMEQ